MIDADAKKILEAVLFSSAEPVGARQLAYTLGEGSGAKLRRWVAELNEEYERTNRTFRIQRLGDGWQLRTLPIYKTWLHKADPVKPVKLTQATLETLAIVAYRQPVTRAEVEHLRGVDCSSGLRSLLDKKLIRILGKDKTPGRPILYGTSRHFLSLFNLTDLKDLPTLEDFDLAQPDEGTPQTTQEAG